VRAVAVSHDVHGDVADSYAVVGHSGPNGDQISPLMVGRGTQTISYPEDAAPLFTAGEYFDLHSRCMAGEHWTTVQIWYVPAPRPAIGTSHDFKRDQWLQKGAST
jgi:hypothetical protein